ncbi:DUF6385 domain-containing protein [Paenibacillus sp. SI8]|uniref:DUF6385 domain-containing protein n=1 Tax=unclassified Paenibacillus TaxID=185978 RepID=UPI003466FC64
MPNFSVYNLDPNELQTLIFGSDGTNSLPLNTDSTGRLNVGDVNTVTAIMGATITGGTVSATITAGTLNAVEAVTIVGGTVSATITAGTLNAVQAATIVGGTLSAVQAATIVGGTLNAVQAATIVGGTLNAVQAATIVGGTLNAVQAATIVGGTLNAVQAATIVGGTLNAVQAATIVGGTLSALLAGTVSATILGGTVSATILGGTVSATILGGTITSISQNNFNQFNTLGITVSGTSYTPIAAASLTQSTYPYKVYSYVIYNNSGAATVNARVELSSDGARWIIDQTVTGLLTGGLILTPNRFTKYTRISLAMALLGTATVDVFLDAQV